MQAFLFLATVLLIGWFVTAPLRGTPTRAPTDGAELLALRAARDAKLRELRDAELDFATGKLALREYELVDVSLRSEVAEILRRLDAHREQR